MIAAVECPTPPRPASRANRFLTALREDEARRDGNYPISRWYLRPLAGWLAARLAQTFIRPSHVTLCGLLCASCAAAVLLTQSELAPVSAFLVLAWWFCDRTDGQLARRQQSVTPLGAWLDANLDELVDLGLHAALAATAASQRAQWAWPLLIAFLFGKYLLMHGLTSLSPSVPCLRVSVVKPLRAFRSLYHLPGNADVRAHLLILALLTGWFTTELALIAVYYNVRWMVRYALVIGRDRRQPT